MMVREMEVLVFFIEGCKRTTFLPFLMVWEHSYPLSQRNLKFYAHATRASGQDDGIQLPLLQGVISLDGQEVHRSLRSALMWFSGAMAFLCILVCLVHFPVLSLC